MTNSTRTKQKAVITQDQINDAVKDVVKKKRKRPDLSEMFSPQTEPGDISKMLSQTLTIAHWPPIDTSSPQEIEERIDQYHMYCLQNDMKPSVSGMALAIGVDRSTLWKWENGVESNKPQEVRNMLKKGREINEVMMVELMQCGKLNPVSGIFLLKNNHGFKDQQDVVITPNTPLQQLDDSEAQQKILDALPDVTD